MKKIEKAQKKLLDSKSGGYLDEMDLPPMMSDDEGGEWVEEEDDDVEAVAAQMTGLTGLNGPAAVDTMTAASSRPTDSLDSHPTEGLKMTS